MLSTILHLLPTGRNYIWVTNFKDEVDLLLIQEGEEPSPVEFFIDECNPADIKNSTIALHQTVMLCVDPSVSSKTASWLKSNNIEFATDQDLDEPLAAYEEVEAGYAVFLLKKDTISSSVWNQMTDKHPFMCATEYYKLFPNY